MKRACILLLSLGFAQAAFAQASAIHRSTLQDLPFPAPAFHTMTTRAAVDSGGTVAAHTHPGIEMAYIASGEGELDIKGQPPRALRQGDSFAIPNGVVHMVHNTGHEQLVMISTYVIDKGAPLVIPAPANP